MTNDTSLPGYAVMGYSLANVFDNQFGYHGPGAVTSLIITLKEKQIPLTKKAVRNKP